MKFNWLIQYYIHPFGRRGGVGEEHPHIQAPFDAKAWGKPVRLSANEETTVVSGGADLVMMHGPRMLISASQ